MIDSERLALLAELRNLLMTEGQLSGVAGPTEVDPINGYYNSLLMSDVVQPDLEADPNILTSDERIPETLHIFGIEGFR